MTTTLKKIFIAYLFLVAAIWGGYFPAIANSPDSSKDGMEPTRRLSGQTYRYHCALNGHKYSTIALTERGPIEIIVWEQKPGEEKLTLIERCQVVSQRFQEFAAKGYLNYLNIGQINQENVICATSETGMEGCLPDGLLIKLEPSDNPYDLLEKLFYSHLPVAEGGPRRTDGKPIDFQQLLTERHPVVRSLGIPNTSEDSSKDKNEGTGSSAHPQQPSGPLPW